MLRPVRIRKDDMEGEAEPSRERKMGVKEEISSEVPIFHSSCARLASGSPKVRPPIGKDELVLANVVARLSRAGSPTKFV